MGTLDIVISKDKMLASPANYKLWRTTMEHVFEKEDLWDVFEVPTGQDSEASSGTAEDSGTTSNATVPTHREQELERKRKRKSFRILKLSLSEGSQDFISDLKDPREAWIKLQELYQTNMLVDVMMLRNKWSMQLIYGLLKELCTAGHQIDDAIVVHKILTHLPSRFDHFVRVVQNKQNIPSISELFSRLHLEDSNVKIVFWKLVGGSPGNEDPKCNTRWQI